MHILGDSTLNYPIGPALDTPFLLHPGPCRKPKTPSALPNPNVHIKF